MCIYIFIHKQIYLYTCLRISYICLYNYLHIYIYCFSHYRTQNNRKPWKTKLYLIGLVFVTWVLLDLAAFLGILFFALGFFSFWSALSLVVASSVVSPPSSFATVPLVLRTRFLALGLSSAFGASNATRRFWKSTSRTIGPTTFFGPDFLMSGTRDSYGSLRGPLGQGPCRGPNGPSRAPNKPRGSLQKETSPANVGGASEGTLLDASNIRAQTFVSIHL